MGGVAWGSTGAASGPAPIVLVSPLAHIWNWLSPPTQSLVSAQSGFSAAAQAWVSDADGLCCDFMLKIRAISLGMVDGATVLLC